MAAAMLFGVTPIDPLALAGAATTLGIVSIAACYIRPAAHHGWIRPWRLPKEQMCQEHDCVKKCQRQGGG
jgi:hypothetical protein